jgi:hypothetical protein
MGLAFDAAGTPSRENPVRREAPKGGAQLDRAALFRPAQVGECGAVKRERAAAPVQRGQQRAQKRPAPAFGCNVVWSN